MKTIRPFAAARSCALLLPVLALVPMKAQPIIAPAPPGEAAVQAANPTAAGTTAPPVSSLASALATDEPLIQQGPIGIRPHATYRALYGVGIEAGPGNPRDSYIQSFSPGVLFDLGKYWLLDYTPTWTVYSNAAFRNTFDQAATLSGRVPLAHGSIGAAQTYDTSSAMLVETGRQTHQTVYSTLVEDIYSLGQHTTLDLGVSRSSRQANAVTTAPEWTTADWVQWSSTNWLRYEFTPRLAIAAGVTFGYSDVTVGPDMRSTLPQGRITWKPAEKITINAQAGREDRQFLTGAHPRLKSPVYTAWCTYQVLPTTSLMFDVTRSISSSYFANQVTKAKGWNLGLQQRLFEKLYLEASLAEQDSGYLATDTNFPVQRDDRYHAVNVRLTTVLLHHLTFALLYQTGRNESSDVAYIFHSHQYGAEISLRF